MGVLFGCEVMLVWVGVFFGCEVMLVWVGVLAVRLCLFGWEC